MKEIDSPNMGFTLFNCTNIVYATGGPAGIYLTSVYPESQTGASGIAFEAGVRGVNLTEWQYGWHLLSLGGIFPELISRFYRGMFLLNRMVVMKKNLRGAFSGTGYNA